MGRRGLDLPRPTKICSSLLELRFGEVTAELRFTELRGVGEGLGWSFLPRVTWRTPHARCVGRTARRSVGRFFERPPKARCSKELEPA